MSSRTSPGQLQAPAQTRARRTWSSAVLCGLILAALVSTRWVRLNLSPSLPYGVYRLAPVPASLSPGTLVVLPVPESVLAWHPWWIPLLKPVAGVAGDIVCHQEQRLYVNGADFGLVHTAARGKALPHLDEGCTVVPEQHVFLASPAPKSLDARYFGPVPIRAITAIAFPLLTWR